MDTKEYIQSGAIEAYVLGLATEHEVAEIEKLSREYAEIKKAIHDFEISLENGAFENAVDPPGYVKSSLERRLANEFYRIEEPTTIRELGTTRPDNVRSLPARKISFWKYLAAACVVLLVGSTALNFYFYSGFRDSNEKYQALLTERNTLQANNAAYQSRLNNIQQSLRLMEDPRMISIKMLGVPGKEQNLATVFWNTQTKEVYVYPNFMEKIPPGKQYQLWAIVDGKPVNAGMIGDCEGLCKMKVIDRAQAFAVTLEKEGGSETPTSTAMYVVGKV